MSSRFQILKFNVEYFSEIWFGPCTRKFPYEYRGCLSLYMAL